MDRNECIHLLKKQGANLIPLIKGDKKPLISWKEYTHKKYEQPIPDGENIGVVCGKTSENLVVIDSDIPDITVLDKILPNALNHTLVVKTSKVYHIYIKVPTLPNTLRLTGPLGRIDVQSSGTYVVAPTSTHPSGITYEIVSNTTEIAIVYFEQIISSLERMHFLPSQSHISTMEIKQNGVSEGMRNNSMFKIACEHLYKQKLDEHTAWSSLQAINSKNKPPDRKSTRLNSSHVKRSRMPSSA